VAWAATFARGPLAVHALAKHAIDTGLDLSLAEGLDVELEDFVAAFRTEDSTIGIKSFLAEGPGKATFTGR
jgi:enoyl-CoA hydratase